jgi:hypothetical protein
MLLYNLRQIVQIVDDDETKYLINKDMSSVKVLEDENADLAVFVQDGLIAKIGKYSQVF